MKTENTMKTPGFDQYKQIYSLLGALTGRFSVLLEVVFLRLEDIMHLLFEQCEKTDRHRGI